MFCTVNEFKSKVKVSDLFPSYEFSIKIYAKVHLIIIHNFKKNTLRTYLHILHILFRNSHLSVRLKIMNASQTYTS